MPSAAANLKLVQLPEGLQDVHATSQRQTERWFLLFLQLPILLFFFFSSRRRHTRSLCDWSSDVCSSDLAYIEILRGHFHQSADCGVGSRCWLLNVDRLVRNNFTGYWFRSDNDTAYQAPSTGIGMDDGNEPWNYGNLARFLWQDFGAQADR